MVFGPLFFVIKILILILTPSALKIIANNALINTQDIKNVRRNTIIFALSLTWSIVDVRNWNYAMSLVKDITYLILFLPDKDGKKVN